MRGVEGGYYHVFTPGNIYECVNVCTGTVSSCMNRSFISHSSHGSNDDGLMKGTGTGYIICVFFIALGVLQYQFTYGYGTGTLHLCSRFALCSSKNYAITSPAKQV